MKTYYRLSLSVLLVSCLLCNYSSFAHGEWRPHNATALKSYGRNRTNTYPSPWIQTGQHNQTVGGGNNWRISNRTQHNLITARPSSNNYPGYPANRRPNPTHYPGLRPDYEQNSDNGSRNGYPSKFNQTANWNLGRKVSNRTNGFFQQSFGTPRPSFNNYPGDPANQRPNPTHHPGFRPDYEQNSDNHSRNGYQSKFNQTANWNWGRPVSNQSYGFIGGNSVWNTTPRSTYQPYSNASSGWAAGQNFNTTHNGGYSPRSGYNEPLQWNTPLNTTQPLPANPQNQPFTGGNAWVQPQGQGSPLASTGGGAQTWNGNNTGVAGGSIGWNAATNTTIFGSNGGWSNPSQGQIPGGSPAAPIGGFNQWNGGNTAGGVPLAPLTGGHGGAGHADLSYPSGRPNERPAGSTNPYANLFN